MKQGHPMKQGQMIWGLLLILVVALPPVWGQDMREVRVQTREIEVQMQQKAAQELEAAKKAAQESRRRITEDRESLDQAIAALKQRIKSLDVRISSLKKENEGLTAQDRELGERLATARGTVKELSGVIRMNAKDISTFVDSSFLSGIYATETEFLREIAGNTMFPGMGHIRRMADLLFERIEQGGSVLTLPVRIVNRAGKAQECDALVLGAFTAAYRLPGETGFLNYTSSGQKLFALSKLPSSAMQEHISRYMDGERPAVPMDISRGGALRQLTHELSLAEQIPEGGPIVWPILAILGLGSLITLERLFFLLRRKIRLETVCSKIETLAQSEDWEACRATCGRYRRNPVVRVIQSGIESRDLPREDMENAVQEAILKEIPSMERFLSTMGMLAAIAPLLGLLGTVTGMIDTFHVITMHGTGDPRMMSGGISEALVTTMLGLSVAIPIMLSHTLLSKAVENTVGLMEEKAVALINIVQRLKGA